MKKRLRSVAKEEEAGRGGGRPSQSGTALLRGPAMKQGLRCRSQGTLAQEVLGRPVIGWKTLGWGSIKEEEREGSE